MPQAQKASAKEKLFECPYFVVKVEASTVKKKGQDLLQQ